MSEIRKNNSTGEHVLFSEIRAKRPMRFNALGGLDDEPSLCPFCPQNERLAAPLIEKYGEIRVIENMYPALCGGDGVHEVLIDTPSHDRKTHDLTEAELIGVLSAIKSRLVAISADPRIKCIQAFKNQGINAGASQAHSHWQIIAMTKAPELKLRQEEGDCSLCRDSIVKQLVIAETENFTAFCPFASRFGYETVICPKRHISRFAELNDILINELAALFSNLLKRMIALLGNIDYNIILSDGLIPDNGRGHVHIQIIPRLGRIAGFELATGCYICSVFPEKAAEEYRRAKPTLDERHHFGYLYSCLNRK